MDSVLVVDVIVTFVSIGFVRDLIINCSDAIASANEVWFLSVFNQLLSKSLNIT